MPAPKSRPETARPDAAETWRLIRLARAGDRDAMDRLVRENRGLVGMVAVWYRDSGVPHADLMQQGSFGLLRAIETFDPAKGTFAGLAVSWIRDAIDRLVCEAPTVHIPKYILRARRRLDKGMKVDMGEATRNNVEKSRRSCFSLNGRECIPDHHEPLIDAVDTMDELESLSRGFESLDRAERELLAKRYGLDGARPMSFAEIAEQVGISEDWARGIVGRAETRLRAKLTG